MPRQVNVTWGKCARRRNATGLSHWKICGSLAVDGEIKLTAELSWLIGGRSLRQRGRWRLYILSAAGVPVLIGDGGRSPCAACLGGSISQPPTARAECMIRRHFFGLRRRRRKAGAT